MQRQLQSALLATYRVVFARGLLRFAWGRRVFFTLYDIYKARMEAGEIDALRRWVPAGARVVDVGANVGFFAMRFAEWVGAGGQVIALEPESRNHQELQRRVNDAGRAAVVVVHRAVADRHDGEVRLEVNPDHPGDHKIGDDGIAVKAWAVDSLCLPDGRPVTLIKIDVQGAELRVLEGAKGVLMRDRPALFVELDPRALDRFGTDIACVLVFLATLGYRPHLLTRSGPVQTSQAAIDGTVARRGYVDVLFLAGETMSTQAAS